MRKTHTCAVVGAALACAIAVSSADAAAPPIVRTRHDAGMGAALLVNRSGRTLYDLSVERHGRFICDTKACLALWKPLVVAKGTKPRGAVPLGTIMRPDGRIQVTFHGAPLYTFVEDRKAGDVRGQGFRDVGVWHAATVGTSTSTTTPPSPTTTTGGAGYTYP